MTATNKYNADSSISRQGLILFYQNLLRKGIINIGSAGYKRLTELIDKKKKYERLKRYGYARRNAGTTE